MTYLYTPAGDRAVVTNLPFENLPVTHQDERKVLMFREGLQRSGDHDRRAVVPAHAVQGKGKTQSLFTLGI
jgi:hypothetical protein